MANLLNKAHNKDAHYPYPVKDLCFWDHFNSVQKADDPIQDRNKSIGPLCKAWCKVKT